MRDNDGKLLALIPAKLTYNGRYVSRRSHPLRRAISIKSPVVLMLTDHIDPPNCPPLVCSVPLICFPGAC